MLFGNDCGIKHFTLVTGLPFPLYRFRA